MNQKEIKELLENEEMEVNESLYLKQLIEMEEYSKQQESKEPSADLTAKLTGTPSNYPDDSKAFEALKDYLDKHTRPATPPEAQPLDTFLSRLGKEQRELLEKKIKLADFLSKGNVVDIVGERQHKYLMLQLQTMETYNMILEMRILDLQSVQTWNP